MTTKWDTSRVSSPGANNAATVTLAAPGSTKRWVVWSVTWSYNNTPTNGYLRIAEGSATVFEIDISNAGPGQVIFTNGIIAAHNAVVTVSLYAGGTSILGKVNVEASEV